MLNQQLHVDREDQRHGDIAPVLREATRAIEDKLIQLLKARPERFAPSDLNLAAFLIVNGMETLNERFLLERPEPCSETMVTELTAMVLRNLDPPGGGLNGTGRKQAISVK